MKVLCALARGMQVMREASRHGDKGKVKAKTDSDGATADGASCYGMPCFTAGYSVFKKKKSVFSVRERKE